MNKMLPVLALMAATEGCVHQPSTAPSFMVDASETHAAATRLLANIQKCDASATLGEPSGFATAARPYGTKSVYYSPDASPECIEGQVGHTIPQVSLLCVVRQFHGDCDMNARCADSPQATVFCGKDEWYFPKK